MRMHTDRRGPVTAIVVALLALMAPVVATQAAPGLTTSDPRPAAGYFRLSWDGGGPVELEEATQPDFGDARLIYRGADASRAMSGKPDGSWYYRVRRADGPAAWSEPLRVEVRHHPLRRALFFFVMGLGVFLATVLLVFGGGARSRDG